MAKYAHALKLYSMHALVTIGDASILSKFGSNHEAKVQASTRMIDLVCKAYLRIVFSENTTSKGTIWDM